MAKHIDFGRNSEEAATDFLQKKGYRILAKNFRYQKAELDIIAEFDDKIIVVEVKARSSNYFINPEEAVDKRKMKLILLATDFYLQENTIEKEVRFDIISILQKDNDELEIKHIENAFEAFDIQ